jgi:NTE family protein
MDLTRKLIAWERVTWALRLRDERAGTYLSGQAEAQFRDGKITSLRLGPLPPGP